MSFAIRTCLLAIAAFSILASAASAQTERVSISSAIAWAGGDGGPTSAVGVAGGVQLAPHAGVEIELLYVPRQTFRRDSIVPQLFPAVPPIETTGRGRTLAFLSSFVTSLEIGRVRPYALLGGGFAHVQRHTRAGPGSISMMGTVSTSGPMMDATSADSGPALTTGGGVEIRVWKRLGVSGDVRYLRVFGDASGFESVKHMTRVGARIGYWF